MNKILFYNQKKIFSSIKSIIKKYPYFVIIILHEYLRNIEPYDPHIKFKEKNPKKRILKLQENILKLVEIIKTFGSYSVIFKKTKKNFLTETATTFADRNKEISKLLKKEGIKNFKRVTSGAKYDHSTGVMKYKDIGKSIWGDGDIRLLIRK